jgi:methionine aminotransferase
MSISSKLPNVGTTIFTVMSKLAQTHNAINLSQGFPNFPVDDELISTYHSVLDENTHQYVPMQGYPPLLIEIAQKVQTHYKRSVKPESEVLVTAGATQAIFTTIQALIHREEEVIILDPSYDCYAPAVELCGGKPVHVNMNADFSVDWDKVENAISHKTKMLIVNNPHNPGGTVFSEQDIRAIEKIMEKHPSLILLSDEVYEYIFFEQPHISINTREKIRNRAVIVSSFGKTFHVTGWKIGYIVAPDELLNEIKKVHQFNVFCVNSTAQITLANYLPKTNLNELSDFYQSKRDVFRSRMKNSRFELLPCQGSYFQVARYSEISSKNDVEFAKEMTIEHGVAVIPVSVFNQDAADHKLIRFCFAKDEDTIVKATQKLCQI